MKEMQTSDSNRNGTAAAGAAAALHPVSSRRPGRKYPGQSTGVCGNRGTKDVCHCSKSQELFFFFLFFVCFFFFISHCRPLGL